MFIGEYQHSIDPKGRLFIPARFREGLGSSFILTKGLDRCLFVYSHQEWAVMEQRLKSLPFTRADARAFARLFFSGAVECEVDKQGRILVPAGLREYAKLEKEVMILGVSTRVEIWSRAGWDHYNAEAAVSYEEIAEKLVDLETVF